MNLIQISKPTAKDSARVRNLLKVAGIDTYVKKTAWTIMVGRQCERISTEVANMILKIADDNKLLVVQRDIIESLISHGICDSISLQILA